MLQADNKKVEDSPNKKTPSKIETPLDKVNKENLGAHNRPQLLVRQLAY